jgi:HNH endonuclease
LSSKVLTARRLRQLLAYDASTGIFRWRSRPDKGQFNSCFAGKIAGTTQSMGYTQVCIWGKKYLASRLAWLFVHNKWPAHDVDHVNGMPWDNRLENLRSASKSENRANSRRPKNSSSGRKGVYLYRRKWHATIAKDYKQYYLGGFSTIEAAAAAYAAAAKQIFGDFARAD